MSDDTDRRVVVLALVAAALLAVGGIAYASHSQWTRSSDTRLVTDSDVAVEFSTNARSNFDTAAPFAASNKIALNYTNFSGASGTAEVEDFNATEPIGTGTELRTLTIEDTGAVRVNRTGQPEWFFAPLNDAGRLTHGGVIVGDVTFDRSNSSVEHYYSADDNSVKGVVEFQTGLPEDEVVVAYDENRGQALDSGLVQADGDVALALPALSSVQMNYKNGTDQLNFTNSTGALINQSLNATIRLFENYPDGDRIWVVGNTTSNGTLDVSGVPTTIPLTVNVNGSDSDYYARLAWLSSLEDQNTVYLINKTEYPDAPIVQFKVEDRSGNFGQDAVLYLQRGINTSSSPTNQLEYRTVAGDILGVSRSVSVRLIPGERYRIVLRSPDGDTRTRGPFVARTDKEVVLEVGELDFSFNEPTDGARLNLTREVTNSGGNKRVVLGVDFTDPSNQTTDLEILIHERNNKSNVLTTLSAGSVADPLGTFTWTSSDLTGTNANTSWVADYEYVRNGTTTSGVRTFGTRQFSLDFPLGDGWRTIIATGFLLVLGGVFSLGNARIGALIIPAVALLFYQIQWIGDGNVSVVGIAIAAAVAVAYNLMQTSGDLIR